MMTLLKMLLTEWKLTLLAMAIALSTVLYLRLETVTAQRDLEIANHQSWLQAVEAAEIAAKTESDQIAKEINDGIPKLVEQAKKTAIENYKRKFGSGYLGCGIRIDSVPVQPGGDSGEAGSTKGTDGVPESEFVAACASDAAIIGQWKHWAEEHKLKVK